MNDRLNPNIGRRDLLRVVVTFAGTATATASGAVLAAASDTSNPANKKDRARYQADSPEVQTFYRVNRYPPK
jgi:nitrous oxide reductase